MIDATEYMKMFIALLAIVDPLTVIPLFVLLTGHQTERERQRIARIASITAAVVFVATIVAGEFLLALFGISIASFKVGGGIILLVMSLEMMQARRILSRHTAEEDREAEDRSDIGIVPLAIPLLAGPGAISTVIIYTHASDALSHLLILALLCLLIALVTWVALRAADRVGKMLGRTGMNVITRIMGLILSAVAVEFIAGGIATLLPGLAQH